MLEALPLTLTSQQVQVLKTLLYFDVFRYPLTAEELFENSSISISKPEFMTELEMLFSAGVLKKEKQFILLAENSGADIIKRTLGNGGARKMMPHAYRYGRILSHIPFIEGVCISGGLSKNYYDRHSDVDFFVITSPGRVWIARTLFIIAFKCLPGRYKKFWCANYFISRDNLQIPDVNPFTGTELAFLLPVVNYKLYRQLLDENSWYRRQFPNKHEHKNLNCSPPSRALIKRIAESILSGRVGNAFDSYLLRITLNRWRKKYELMSDEDFNLQFRSRKDVCKRHTKGFQNKVLALWSEKLSQFEARYNVSLTS